MKKRLFIIFVISILFVGCFKSNKNNVVENLNQKLSDLSAYQFSGLLSISNNEDTYNYDVEVSYKEGDNYRVSIINKSNGHEQIILKSNDEVYVITPALNKSFKFQSNWPLNNSQIYIFESILNDINKDNDKVITDNSDGYVIETKVNYPNNINLVKQKIYVDKDSNITKIEVLNDSSVVEMTMSFDKVNDNPKFSDNYFDLDSIISNIEVEEKDEKTSSIDNVIYPLYVPTGTVLTC